jgi:hypothetical protein
MKYIVVQSPSGETAVLFPRGFMHRWVAERFAPMPVISAGFVRQTAEGLQCYGRSAGLCIPARPQDTSLVMRALSERDPEFASI